MHFRSVLVLRICRNAEYPPVGGSRGGAYPLILGEKEEMTEGEKKKKKKEKPARQLKLNRALSLAQSLDPSLPTSAKPPVPAKYLTHVEPQ